MKLNEITETGYYTCELDTERETIFEVIKNTDEVWLKEAPEQTLLIDEWTYEYTDEDGRKHYEIYGGNLVSVVNAEPFDVVKITDTKYIISGKMGTHLMEDKPTRLEITEHQLKHKEQECEELKEDKELWKSNFEGMVGAIEDLSQQLDKLKVELEQEKALKETYLTCYKAKHEDIKGELFKLRAENDTLFKAIEEVNKINKKLKAENERLDKELSKVYEDIKLSPLCYKCEEECLQKEINQLKADNEQLEEELSVIQHNCNREGCKYYDDDTFKVFYECKAQKALQLSANSITTKYCDLLKAIIEIKAICNNNDELQGDFNAVDCDKYKLGKHNLANKILQKIKECRVEE